MQPAVRLDRRRARVTARAISDKRRYARARLPLKARMLRSDGRECDVAVSDISVGGLAGASDAVPRVNSRVVLLVESLGRVEGVAVRVAGDRFGVRFDTITDRRRVKLADTLIWEINRSRLELTDDRQARRRGKVGGARVRFSDGVEAEGDYIDASETGVSLASAVRPRPGEAASVENRSGRIARLHERGFAVAFDREQDEAKVPLATSEMSFGGEG